MKIKRFLSGIVLAMVMMLSLTPSLIVEAAPTHVDELRYYKHEGDKTLPSGINDGHMWVWPWLGSYEFDNMNQFDELFGGGGSDALKNLMVKDGINGKFFVVAGIISEDKTAYVVDTKTKVYYEDKLMKTVFLEDNQFGLCAYISLEQGATSQPSTFKEEATNTVYRLLNKSNNKHLLTTDVNEARTLVSQGWVQEPSAGIASGGGSAVYRLYNPNSGEHLFTSDTNECKVLTSQHGWVYDNNGKALFTGVENGSKPVYRLYNPKSPVVSSHHYTSDANEIKVLTTQQGWVYDNNAKPVYYLN